MHAELDCASFVHVSFCAEVGPMGELWRTEGPQPVANATSLDGGRPAPFVLARSKKSAGAARPRAADVLRVNGVRRITQIVDTVVVPDPVYVVDLIGRPSPMDVEPCEPVGQVQRAANPNQKVPVAPGASSSVACLLVRGTHQARKYTSLWIVIKKFAQTLCGELGFAHNAVLLRQLVGSGTPWLPPRRTAPL